MDTNGKVEKPPKPFDLSERTSLFGEAVIDFCKKIPKNVVTFPLIGQLVRAGTSVGANYWEAAEGVSKKDFRNRIGTCKKEARESKFWMRMIVRAEECMREEARLLWQEGHELHLIFCAIFRRTKDKD